MIVSIIKIIQQSGIQFVHQNKQNKNIYKRKDNLNFKFIKLILLLIQDNQKLM